MDAWPPANAKNTKYVGALSKKADRLPVRQKISPLHAAGHLSL
jgi:hypothetical protein